jgi:hypothetical protein
MPRPGLYSNSNPLADDPQAYLEPSVVEGMPMLIGRDPRTITVEQLNALGHEKQPLLRVIRTNCIDATRSEAQLAHAENRAAALRKASRLEHENPEGSPQGPRTAVQH